MRGWMWISLGTLVLAAGCEHRQRDAVADKAPVPPLAVAADAGRTATMEVTATVAAVTLADECGPSVGAKRGRSCVQSTMQLMLTAGPDGAASKVEVTRIELFDDVTDAPLGELVARTPTRWGGVAYGAWDGVIAPGAAVNASWDVTAPDWSKLGGTREAAADRRFRVRVTLRVAELETSAEGAVKVVPKPKIKRVKSPPIIIEPPVMT